MQYKQSGPPSAVNTHFLRWYTSVVLMVVPAWTDKFLLPAFFTLLGALVSLFVSEWKDHHQAKKRKQAFLRAVGMELEALSDQLNASLNEVDASLIRLQGF